MNKLIFYFRELTKRVLRSCIRCPKDSGFLAYRTTRCILKALLVSGTQSKNTLSGTESKNILSDTQSKYSLSATQTKNILIDTQCNYSLSGIQSKNILSDTQCKNFLISYTK